MHVKLWLLIVKAALLLVCDINKEVAERQPSLSMHEGEGRERWRFIIHS